MMVFTLGSALGKYALKKISYSMKDFITNPRSIRIQDESGNSRYLCMMFSKPNWMKNPNQISLVILGDVQDEIVKKIEDDLIAGIAMGHYFSLEQQREKKFKKENLKILENKFSNYNPVYNDVVKLGLAFGTGIYKAKYLRKEIMKTSNDKTIDWGEMFNNMQVKAKEKKYKGNSVIIFEEKYFKMSRWVVPIEAVKIWQNIQLYSDDEAIELVTNLYNFQQKIDEKEIKRIFGSLESYISDENKRRRKKLKEMRKKR